MDHRNKVMRTIFLFVTGFLCCWFFGMWRGGVSAQPSPVSENGSGMIPYREPVSGQPVLDQKALVAGNRTVSVTRPLEVPALYAFDSMVGPDCQQIVLVDSETKRICVYHVRPSGNDATIRMVASRNFQWDLKLDDFNGDGLSPSQIRDQVLRDEQ